MSTTYSKLRADIADWLDRDDLESQIATFIAHCEDEIYRNLRLEEAMIVSFSDTISNGTIDVPDEFLELAALWVDDSTQRVIEQTSLNWLLRTYGTSRVKGDPRHVSIDGNFFRFGPTTDVAVTGTYYKRPADLSPTNEQNWMARNAPDLLLYGSLIQAVDYVGDDSRLRLWEARYNRIMRDLQERDDRKRFSERSPIRARTQ